MLRLRGVTLDSADPDRLAHFWADALGYDTRSLWKPYAGLKDPSGRDPHLTFQRGEGSGGPSRLHLDLYADDVTAEVERLVGLGARRIRRVEEGDTWWWVLQDPDGNEFCVVSAQGADRSV